MDLLHQGECDQQRDEVNRHQRQMTDARLKGLEPFVSGGHFSQSAADVHVTHQDENERQPENKNRVQTAEHIIGVVVVAGQSVDLPVVTEITVNQHRVTEGESCEKADRYEHSDDNKGPERGDQTQHEPVGHFHLVVQRETDRDESVVGESHQVEGLHGEAGVAEEQEGQAVVVGDEVMVEQEDVQDLRHQSRVTEQVHEGQVEHRDVLRSSQVVIQAYDGHDGGVPQH